MEPQLEQWLEEWLAGDGEQRWTEKQIAIVRAAVDVIGEKGYAAASTSEIAQRAGVSEGTIFKTFKSKKELLLKIVEPIISKMVAPFVLRDFTKVLDSDYPTFEAFLRAVIRNRLEFARDHLPVIRIFLQEVPFHNDLREIFLREVGSRVLDRMVAIIRRYQQRGEILDIPPLTVIRLAVSTGLGFLLARFIVAPERDWDEEAEIEQTVSFIMRGLRPPAAGCGG